MIEPIRRAWFDRGVHAVTELFGGRYQGYICPLCGIVYREDALDRGDLTREHAPPRWFGGHRVALTCSNCNSRAGSTLDTQMQRYDQIAAFDMGTMTESEKLRVRIDIEGNSLNAEIRASGGSYVVNYPERINDPLSWANAQQIFQQAREDESIANKPVPTNFPLHEHNPRLASVGWLRSAYIVAFAALGYRYALHPDVAIVRTQIVDFSSQIIEKFMGTDSVTPKEVRNMYLVFEPLELSCLLVQTGRYTVILPPIGFGLDFYERTDFGKLQRLCNDGIPPDQHLIVKWPREPHHAWDLPNG